MYLSVEIKSLSFIDTSVIHYTLYTLLSSLPITDVKNRPATDYILARWAYNILAAVGYEATPPQRLVPKWWSLGRGFTTPDRRKSPAPAQRSLSAEKTWTSTYKKVQNNKVTKKMFQIILRIKWLSSIEKLFLYL